MGIKTTERGGNSAFANDRLQRLGSVLGKREYVLRSHKVPNTDLMRVIHVGNLTIDDRTVRFFMDPEHYLRGVNTIITDIMLDLRREGCLEEATEKLKEYGASDTDSS